MIRRAATYAVVIAGAWLTAIELAIWRLTRDLDRRTSQHPDRYRTSLDRCSVVAPPTPP